MAEVGEKVTLRGQVVRSYARPGQPREQAAVEIRLRDGQTLTTSVRNVEVVVPEPEPEPIAEPTRQRRKK